MVVGLASAIAGERVSLGTLGVEQAVAGVRGAGEDACAADGLDVAVGKEAVGGVGVLVDAVVVADELSAHLGEGEDGG